MNIYTKLIYLRVFLISFIVATVCFRSVSQSTDGSIKGHIVTSDGKPVAYVNVVLKEINKGTATAEDGSYLIKNIKPGNYTLITSFVGLQSQEKSITVTSGQVSKVDFAVSENAQQLAEIVINGAKSTNQKPVSIGKVAIKPMDLPQSITVIGRDILEQQQTLHISDVLRNVNGLYVMGTTGGTQEELAGRGFSYGSSNTFKNGIRFNNGVMPETSALESVEVMKGSNAILYGNVAPGGALNLVTKKPKFENGLELSFRVGSYNLYKPSLDVYGPINNSKRIAYRINTSYENAGSFRDNVSSERFYINPSFQVKITEKTDILVEGDYLNDNRTPDFGTGALDYKIIDIPRSRFLGVSWSKYNVEQKSLTTTITHHFNGNWQLQTIGGYQNYKNDQYTNTRPNASGNMVKSDGTWARALQKTGVDENYYLAQSNLTGTFNTGFLKHTLLFGAEVDQYKTETPAYDIFANSKSKIPSINYDIINVFDLSINEPRTDIPATKIKSESNNTSGRAGVYVQDLITITEKIKLLAGIRYSYQEQSSFTNTYKYDTVKNTRTTSWAKASTRYDQAFTPRFGLVYQPWKNTSVFASYANSFTPNTGIDVTGKNLAPSLIDQFEVGVKNDLFNGILSANVTLYKIVNSNQTQTVLTSDPRYNASFPTAQELSGEVTSKGAEIDIISKTYHGLSFIGGYSYNTTKYTKSNTYIVGSKLRYNPSHTANASIYYTLNQSFLKGLNAGFTAFYVGERVAGRSTRLTVSNDTYKLMPLPDYFLFDVSAGYTFQKISLRVKVTNLLNKLSYYAHDDNSINPVAPRMVVATVSYKL